MTLESVANLDYVERSKNRLVVYSAEGPIEGTFHHTRGTRLSDALQKACTSEPFLMLTDARSISDNVISSAPFVLIRTSNIRLVVPLDRDE